MRQVSHYSHRHVNSIFWSLTEDFINEYGSKFLNNRNFIVDWPISKENINAFKEWYVTEQIKRHVNLTHTQAVYSTQWRMHIISFYIHYKFKELPVHVRVYTLMQVKFL